MWHFGHTRTKRLAVVGLLTLPLAVAGGVWAAGSALGAGSASPSMEVLPAPTGLNYGQTVEIKGHNLPKGSGSVAATICGLEDASGKVIANPGADDCAGAQELGKLVILKQWQSNGEFDANYTLPQSGQKFGTNQRYCDKDHHCALVLADANPSNPAYHVDTVIQFTDQQPFGGSGGGSSTTTAPGGSTTTAPGSTSTTTPGSTTPTTTGGTTTTTVAPPPSSTPTTAAPGGSSSPGFSLHGSFSGSVGPDGGSFSGSAGGSFTPPSAGSSPAPGGSGGSPSPVPPVTMPQPGSNPIPAPVNQALGQICSQLAAAVSQAGGDASAITTACGAIQSGNGPQELGLVLQNPSLLCLEGASLWQNNAQVTDACNQAATALTPVTSQLGNALAPVLGAL